MPSILTINNQPSVGMNPAVPPSVVSLGVDVDGRSKNYGWIHRLIVYYRVP